MAERLDLEEIEKACAAATPGPWKHGELVERGGEHGVEAYFNVDDINGPDGYPIIETDSGVYAPKLPDAKFICGAREWVPALVARCRELEADLSRRNEAIATLTRLDEREACIQIVEDKAYGRNASEIVSAIRARGGK